MHGVLITQESKYRRAEVIPTSQLEHDARSLAQVTRKSVEQQIAARIQPGPAKTLAAYGVYPTSISLYGGALLLRWPTHRLILTLTAARSHSYSDHIRSTTVVSSRSARDDLGDGGCYLLEAPRVRAVLASGRTDG
jgi:hypothetical protein